MSDEIARRDYFVERSVSTARAEGYDINAEAVARQAARDLGVLDRALAVGDLSTEKRTAPPLPKPRGNAAEGLASSIGATTWERPLGDLDNEKALPKLRGVDAVRLLAMEKRLRLLMEPVPGYVLKIERDPATGAITNCEPLGNQCAYPAFANLLLGHMFCFSRGQGSYREMKYADRWRKYVRAVEDICNRSDAAVGIPWWCK